MPNSEKTDDMTGSFRRLFPKGIHIGSSIYSRVVFLITISLVGLFLSFGVIFRSVYEQNLNTIIRQNGNNIGSLVEGSLYQSMMENDKSRLQSTLDIINTMTGIDDVNLYDENDRLAYSSINQDNGQHSDPDCLGCHSELGDMFPRKEKAYRIVKAGSDCIMNTNDNEHRHLLIRTPILNDVSCYTADCHAHSETDEVLGSLIIKMPLEDLDNAVARSSKKYFVFASAITLILIVIFILFTRRQIQQPLDEIVKASLSVANGNQSVRLEVRPDHIVEMRTVSGAFNEMLDKLQAATDELRNWSQQLEFKVRKRSEELGAAKNELIHIERIASLGKLSSSVAHELNNPLSGILVYTKLIHKQLSNPELYASKRESMLKHLKLIENETKRCGEIVKGLLEFSRKDQENFEPAHLHTVLRETYELMLHPVTIANNRFNTDFRATSDLVFCSPNQIKQACVAIIVNATEAVSANGEITMSTSNPDQFNFRIDITDNGNGMSPDDIPHIFEPFFSTKHGASGIGLGLAIVHGIVQSHKGRIEVDSEPGKGTTMSITLPLIIK